MSRSRASSNNIGCSVEAHSTGVSTEAERRCYCGILLRVHTSMTRHNPCLRFVSCPLRGNNKCKYFVWLDPELPVEAVESIRRLMDRLDQCEKELEGAKLKISSMEQRRKFHFIIKVLLLSLVVVLVTCRFGSISLQTTKFLPVD
ncbi:hypothetical protein ACS0TY_027452 [Phlomoides rotata]